jgi:hypothetical protein
MKPFNARPPRGAYEVRDGRIARGDAYPPSVRRVVKHRATRARRARARALRHAVLRGDWE